MLTCREGDDIPATSLAAERTPGRISHMPPSKVTFERQPAAGSQIESTFRHADSAPVVSYGESRSDRW